MLDPHVPCAMCHEVSVYFFTTDFIHIFRVRPLFIQSCHYCELRPSPLKGILASCVSASYLLFLSLCCVASSAHVDLASSLRFHLDCLLGGYCCVCFPIHVFSSAMCFVPKSRLFRLIVVAPLAFHSFLFSLPEHTFSGSGETRWLSHCCQCCCIDENIDWGFVHNSSIESFLLLLPICACFGSMYLLLNCSHGSPAK